jgi:hypothetical protein
MLMTLMPSRFTPLVSPKPLAQWAMRLLHQHPSVLSVCRAHHDRCGKTSLLTVVAGMADGAHVQGSVRVNGQQQVRIRRLRDARNG